MDLQQQHEETTSKTASQEAAFERSLSAAPFPEGYDPATLLHYYYQMLFIRRFEEKAAEMYTRARIGGYCHLNLGEEATVVGFCEGLEAQDYVYTNYREHGYAIGRGIDAKAVMAELFGKETGCAQGRGGSMHMFDIDKRFMGGYAIVGGQLPLATGAGFAISYRGTNEVVACQMGEGATNNGAFHESLNLAKIYRLPVIFFVVNNQYGMGLEVSKGSAVAEIYRKGCAYDIHSVRVDGNDLFAVKDAMQEAARIAREQHQPCLIEAVSFRLKGHSVVDPDRYRDEEIVKKGRSLDPIPSYGLRLKTAGLADDRRLEEIELQVELDVEEAVRFAEESPDPSLDTLYDYIYVEEEN